MSSLLGDLRKEQEHYAYSDLAKSQRICIIADHISNLEYALLIIPEIISNKDVSIAANKLLRDHIEKVLGKRITRFDHLGKRKTIYG